MSQRPAIIVGPPRDVYEVLVGQHLRAVRVRKSSITLRFDKGKFTRILSNGEYKRGVGLDWVKVLDGLTVRAVSEYNEGLVLDFGLKGIFLKNSGEIEMAERKPSSEASQ